MGLTTWKNALVGRVLKTDVSVAKNYLQEKEIRQLERVVTGFFDYIEDLIERENTFNMEQFATSVNEFLAFRRYQILPDKGTFFITPKDPRELAHLSLASNFRASESRGKTCFHYAERSRKSQSNFRASESRSQACLDYAERSRKSQCKRTFKNVFVPVSHVFHLLLFLFQSGVESGLSAYRSGRSTCDIPFLVVTPVILVDEVYEMPEGREGALQLTKTSVLGEVSLS